MRIVVVGSPRAAWGKTTTAVTGATIAVRRGQRVLLVDCGTNRLALAVTGDAIPLDVSDG